MESDVGGPVSLDDFEKSGEPRSGAAGDVWKARVKKDLPFSQKDQFVALKVFKSEILKQPKQRERIQREYETGAKLRHHNLVPIHHVELDAKDPFLIMEWCDGTDLQAWRSRKQELDDEFLLQLTTELLDVLDFLHSSGVIHRDVKPTNIQVDPKGRIWLLDYGIVRNLRGVDITQTDGRFVGTYRYSAPEYLFKERREPDFRVDLYSLGAVLYYMLHGQEIFATAKETPQVCAAKKDHVLTFSDHTLNVKGPIVKSLLDLSKKLLDPDPELRPPSAGACLDLLAQSLPHHIPLRVYFACSLTGISEDKHKRIKECALVLRQKAEENGFTLYAPSEHTDPRDTATLSSAEVYWIDRERVASADLLFILADQPSFGVGQEAEIAANAGVPLAIFSSEGIKVSRMLRGVPARILAEVEFSDIEDFGSKAADLFKEHKSRLRVRVRTREREYHLRLGNRVRELRQDRSLSLESLAEETGVETNHLKALETRPEQVTSVSLVQLRRIARALGVSPAEMLRDQSGKDQEFEQTFRVSLSELRKFAKKEELSYHKYETLKQRGRSQLLEHLGAKAARQPARPLVAEDWSRLYAAMIQSGEQGDLF